MTFAHLSPVWVVAGLAALAALLFLLQRLRVRHRQVPVVTTLFWRIAAEEAPARTYVERFRHPWAYLLFLLIGSLLWLGFAGPEPRASPAGPFHVLVLDGSASMAAGSRYAQAVAALEKRLGRMPADQRQVLWCGAGVHTLLNPGEHELLLAGRLAGLQPVPAPPGVEDLLRQLAVVNRPGRVLEVTVFGDAPIRAETLALLPELRVSRAPLDPPPAGGNAGITALGMAAAGSGAWDRVDVLVRAEHDDGSLVEPARLSADLDGNALPLASFVPVAAGLLLPDLPAAGGRLTVRLAAADSRPLDDVASLRLPERPRIRVQLSPALAAVVGPALAADPAVEVTADDPRVVIRRQGETIGLDLPALEFVPADADQPAFHIVHPAVLDSAEVFAAAVRTIGLKEIDAMTLADSTGRQIEATVTPGTSWTFEVWEDLLADEYNFTQSRAFPLFIANGVRWLAGVREDHAYLAAGRALAGGPLGHADRVVDEQGRVLDPLGVPFTPEQAGDLRRESGAPPLAVSLLDPASTLNLPADTLRPSAALPPGLGTPILVWVLLAALLLLAWEWYLLQTGRVP